MNLSGKTITVGVSGSIAAYKSCELIRLFVKAGANVHVVTTEDALQFVNMASFYGLTKNRPITSLFDSDLSAGPHITLGQHSDLFVIAPATGNVISKIALGIADDALTSTALAATCPVVVCPAMNTQMFKNSATQSSLKTLLSRGVTIVNGEAGQMACGTSGEGRLAEVDVIYEECLEILKRKPFKFSALTGRKVLITSGPTREELDPVRYISNRSSGKMGSSLSHAFKNAGAKVTVITGPVNVDYGADKVIRVETAKQMFKQVKKRINKYDIIVCCAAVCDFKPAVKQVHKIKKSKNKKTYTLKLKKTKDILSFVSKHKSKSQIVVGFAAETNNYIIYGKSKLKDKGCDIIVTNKVGHNKNFGKPTAKAAIITRKHTHKLGKCSKSRIAKTVVDVVSQRI